MENSPFRWDYRTVIGVPVITVGLSLAAVGANCFEKLSEEIIRIDGKAGCIVGNFKLLDPGQSVLVSAATGTVQQMSIIPSGDVINAAQALLNLSQILLPTVQPLQSPDYLA